MRSLDHHRLGRRGAGARLRRRASRSPSLAHRRRGARRCGRGWCAHERASLDVTRARRLAHASINYAAPTRRFLLPSLLFPLFFLTAFAGGLSSVGDVPGFDFPSGYTAFQFVFVLLQAAAFGGVFTGFAIAADFESRLRAAAAARRAEPARRSWPATRSRRCARGCDRRPALFAVALVAGMQVDGGARRPVRPARAGAARSTSTATLFAAGVALRARTHPGRPADADADLHHPVPRAGLRAAGPASAAGCTPSRGQPGHARCSRPAAT